MSSPESKKIYFELAFRAFMASIALFWLTSKIVNKPAKIPEKISNSIEQIEPKATANVPSTPLRTKNTVFIFRDGFTI
jgi:hypothetical protein